MPIVLTGPVAKFEEVCTVEDAMQFMEYLRTAKTPEVDLSGCTYLHTALLQLLFLARPRVVGAPVDPFLARWVVCGVEMGISAIGPVAEEKGPAVSGRNG